MDFSAENWTILWEKVRKILLSRPLYILNRLLIELYSPPLNLVFQGKALP